MAFDVGDWNISDPTSRSNAHFRGIRLCIGAEAELPRSFLPLMGFKLLRALVISSQTSGIWKWKTPSPWPKRGCRWANDASRLITRMSFSRKLEPLKCHFIVSYFAKLLSASDAQGFSSSSSLQLSSFHHPSSCSPRPHRRHSIFPLSRTSCLSVSYT